jgi:hypothetical protein
MKMMKNLMIAAMMALLPISAFAQSVTSAKVAELTAHRIDRLVVLGKIDASFNKKLAMVEVSAAGPTPVAFRSLVSQTQPTTGAPIQLELLFDAAAKPLSFKVLPGGVAGPDPGYNGGQDAVSLFENSMHYILNNATDPKIAPFYNGLTTVMLTKVKMGDMDMAQAQVMSSATTQKLNVNLMLDGMFMSAEVVP